LARYVIAFFRGLIEAQRIGSAEGGQALALADPIRAHVHTPAARVNPQAERFQGLVPVHARDVNVSIGAMTACR